MSVYFLLVPILLPMICGAALGLHPVTDSKRRSYFVFSVILLTSLAIGLLILFPPGAREVGLQLAGVLAPGADFDH